VSRNYAVVMSGGNTGCRQCTAARTDSADGRCKDCRI